MKTERFLPRSAAWSRVLVPIQKALRCPGGFGWVVAGSFCLALNTAGFPVLDPGKPPGANFDLSHWKLTLPDADASEISPEQLASGSTNVFFSTGPDGAMMFSCPVTGGTTSGSSYPRCELRELLDQAHENVNWKAQGGHVLEANCRVTRMPSTGKVIIGQIHSYSGKGRPLVKLQFHSGTIEALVKKSPNSDSDTRVTFDSVDLGSAINYRIELRDGRLAMRVNSVERSIDVLASDPAWADQTLYFKAGNYCQDNSGSTNEASVVAFYGLQVTHDSAPGGSPRLTGPARGTDGLFRFTLLGQDGSRYVIQISSDLVQWSDVSTNNTASGRFDFIDTDAAAGGRRFYRARQF